MLGDLYINTLFPFSASAVALLYLPPVKIILQASEFSVDLASYPRSRI